MSRCNAGSLRQTLLFAGIFFACALLVKPAQDSLESRLGAPGQEPDLLYFSSPSALKRMALGYDHVLADLYWMRTIQYFARRDEAAKRPVRYKNLSTLLDITTTLDPGLLDAYSAGSAFLSEPDPVGAGQPREALKLMDKGIRAYPGEWRLYFDKGFVYYWYMADYREAGEVWQTASRIAGAPHWMEPLAAMSLSRGGSAEVAIALWEKQYTESKRADVRENARNHLFSIAAARDIWILESLIEKFRAERGYFPDSLSELVRGKETKYRIADPTGTPYEYNSITGTVTLGPDAGFKYIPVPDSFRAQLRIANED